MRPDRFVDMLYVKAEEDFSGDEVIAKKIRQMVVDWENNDADTWELWKHVLSYSYAGQEMTLSRLRSHWDHIWHEHEHYQVGKDFVQKGFLIYFNTNFSHM